MNAEDLRRQLLPLIEQRLSLATSRVREQLAALPSGSLSRRDLEPIAGEVVSSVALFGGPTALELLRELDACTGDALALFPKDVQVPVEREEAVLEAREEASNLAARLGFRPVRRTMIATAVSELARNIHMYAHRGEVRLRVQLTPRVAMVINAADSGPGIANVEAVLAGKIRSRRGMGLGLKGVKALADEFDVFTSAQGTVVVAAFHSPFAPSR